MLDGIKLQVEITAAPDAQSAPRKVLVLFGTRPEAIKLAPVIHELKRKNFRTVVVSSSQHRELLKPFLSMLDIATDYDLRVMKKDQTLNGVAARVMDKLDKILAAEKPDLIIVQGDTTTTLAGALAAFYRRIPVAHVEAGLRSGDAASPFPEEMNRRLVTRIAELHFASTERNRRTLLAEDVASEKIFVTGNTVVDTLEYVLENSAPAAKMRALLDETHAFRRILLTTHRRESFGAMMSGNLRVLRDFVDKRKDVCLIFPVHPNPNVRAATEEILANRERIFLLDPLGYEDFVALMKSVWLIVSDSGGIQEEAPSLGKPLLVLRENTERPEAIRAGVAKLVGGSALSLRRLLEETYAVDAWTKSVREMQNPFGDGRAARRIVAIIEERLGARALRVAEVERAVV